LNAVLYYSGDSHAQPPQGGYFSVTHILNFKINGGATQQPGGINSVTFLDSSDSSIRQDAVFPWNNVFQIAAGGSATFEMWATFNVTTQPALGGGVCSVEDINLSATQIGIPG